jgi:hypothetical protein
MFHSSAFAIAAGVVSVGSAAYGAYATSQATKAQGRATSKSTKEFKKQQQKIEKLVMSIDPTIETPEFDPQAVSKDLGANWQSFIDTANQATANTVAQLQKISEELTPGSTAARTAAAQALGQWTGNIGQQYVQLQRGQPLIEQQQQAISSMIKGELPQVAQEQINRAIAERAGAGFSPMTAGTVSGFQVPQAMLAEQLRQSSEERMRAGLALAPGVIEQRRAMAGTAAGLAGTQADIANTFQTWRDRAAAYITTPIQTAGVGIQLQGLREQALDRQMRAQQATVANQLAQAEALGGVASGTYQANMNQISQQSAAAQQNINAMMGVGSALSGALGGIGSAYGQLAAAGPTAYGSAAAAQQAAPYASGISRVYGMGYVPRATAV